MEVKNTGMDQLLTNVGTQQAPAGKEPADTDRPDFRSLVRRKKEPAAEKAVEKPHKKPDNEPAAEQENPVADEQYVIAAAMMYQAQPELRIVPMQEETEHDAPVEMVQLQTAGETTETAELPELPAEQTEEAEAPVETDVPVEREESPEVKPELPVERQSEAVERPEVEQHPVADAKPEREREDVPRAHERTPRMERAAEDRPEKTEETGTEPTAQEIPLFQHVDAPVVKVAEAPEPVALEAEDGMERLAEQLNGVLVTQTGTDRVEVRLTPEHLGRLTVEISRGERGALSIVLHTESDRAARLLERGLDGLKQALSSGGERETQLQVRTTEESRQFLNPDGQNSQNRQQQQQQGRRQSGRQSAEEFLQQLRLGLADAGSGE